MVPRHAAVLALVVLTACGPWDPPGSPKGVHTVTAHVVDVIDGDTIRVDLDGREVTVRLIGVDTPEVAGPYTHEECYGAEASAFTHQQLDGRDVGLEFDAQREDRFGRTLAYVWLQDGWRLFNSELVRGGCAVPLRIPPDTKYADTFALNEKGARTDRAGLWSACAAR
ncbi:MAG: thermonuclease family protein [Actinomycetota bacterium]